MINPETDFRKIKGCSKLDFNEWPWTDRSLSNSIRQAIEADFKANPPWATLVFDQKKPGTIRLVIPLVQDDNYAWTIKLTDMVDYFLDGWGEFDIECEEAKDEVKRAADLFLKISKKLYAAIDSKPCDCGKTAAECIKERE